MLVVIGTSSVSTGTGATSASLNLVLPGAIPAGAVIVIVFAGAGAAYTTPAGYTIGSARVATVTGVALVSSGSFFKVAAGTEGGTTQAVAIATAQRWAALCIVLGGRMSGTQPDTTAPTSLTSETGASVNSPTVAPTSPDSDLVVFDAARRQTTSASGVTFTVGGAASVAVQATTTATGNTNIGGAIAYEDVLGTAATGTRGWTAASTGETNFHQSAGTNLYRNLPDIPDVYVARQRT